MDFTRPADLALTQRATRGAIVTGVSQALKVGVQMASVVVVSRLLSPSDFGLVAMVAPLFALAMMFQDLGLTQVTIQRDDITHAQVSALFWLNTAASLALALVMIAAAPLAERFYHVGEVGDLVRAFALLVVVAGLGSQHMAILNRRLQFTALAAIDATAAVLGFATSLVFALWRPSYWALFAGSLAMVATPTVAAWLLVRWAPSRPAKPREFRQLVNFGAGLTGFNFINFIAGNIDNVLIGRYSGATQLGAYDRAYKLLLLPLQQVTGPLSRIAVPMLSHVRRDEPRYRQAYLRMLRQMALVVLPGVAFLVACADLVVPTAMGEKWASAAPMFAALGLAGLLKPINSTTGWLFISQARIRDYLRGGLFTTAVSVIAIVIGLHWGALGVAVAYAASEYVKTPVIWWLTTREGPVKLGDVVHTAGPHVLGAIVALGAVTLFRTQSHLGAWPTMILGVVFSYGAGFFAVACFRDGRAAFKDAIAAVQSLLGARLARAG